jgi:hypothetical protein
MSWFLFAVSNRSQLVGMVFILASFLMSWQDPRTQHWYSGSSFSFLKIGMIASFIMFIPFIIYNLSAIIDFPSIFLLGTPFMVWIDPDVNLSIKEFIRLLLG